MTQRLYVLVRGDLSPAQQAVQAGHALIEYMMWSSRTENPVLVYLKVPDLNALQIAMERFPHAFPFYETDLGDELTAFAVDGSHYPEKFQEYRLL